MPSKLMAIHIQSGPDRRVPETTCDRKRMLVLLNPQGTLGEVFLAAGDCDRDELVESVASGYFQLNSPAGRCATGEA